MLAYKEYLDCELCKGSGEYQTDTDRGFRSVDCLICAERYIMELQELLHEILMYGIPNDVAEKATSLLLMRALTPQERLDNAFEAARRI